jgi:N-acetylglucosamine-6-sulfatase
MKRTVAVLASVVSAVALLIFGYRLVASDSAGEQRIQTASARPNIVFVMTDDMPKGLWKSMPTLRSRVSAEGARFTDAYVTQSLCCPSRATVLTGEYPHNHGITGNLAPNGGEAEFRSTGQDQDTIATRMQAQGYRTALLGKYMNGYKGEYVPPGWSYWYTESGKNGINDNGRLTANRSESFPVTIANRAGAFLDGATDEADDPPFMLFYWTTQPHLPTKAPPATATGSRAPGSLVRPRSTRPTFRTSPPT